MMKKITNARLIGKSSLQTLIIDEKNYIQDIYPSQKEEESNLDLQGDWLSLGGVDLQINGGLGLAFPDLTIDDIDKLKEICRYLWQTGVDGFLPTIVTTSVQKIHQALEVIRKYQDLPSNSSSAKIIGVHLEGPFLNYDKRGAHPAEFLLPLSLENVKKVIADYDDLIKIITLAPELDSTGKVIPYLVNQGITVSLGHSLATAEEAEKAFQQGATMVTHAFNAMPSLHHRQAGLLGSAIVNNQVFCGLIADGKHVSSIMLDVFLRASNFQEGVFLVSDALAPIGLSDGVYPWDSRRITVKDGTAKLADGTLSGTTLPLFVGAENLVKWGIATVEQVIALVTSAPRQAINLPDLQVGIEANLIRWQCQENNLTWERINL